MTNKRKRQLVAYLSQLLEQRNLDEFKELLARESWILKSGGADGELLWQSIATCNEPAFRHLLGMGIDIDSRSDEGLTVLHLAIECNDLEKVRLLLREGADIEARGMNNWTPLHSACARGHVEIARLLLESEADVEAGQELDCNWTPLMVAAFCGQAAIVRLLLEQRAYPQRADEAGRTARQLALEQGHSEIVAELDRWPQQRYAASAKRTRPDQTDHRT